MLLAADYPFLDVFWTMLVFFVWVAWFMLLFRVFGDVFRRQDIGGGVKVLWLIFVIAVPFLGCAHEFGGIRQPADERVGVEVPRSGRR